LYQAISGRGSDTCTAQRHNKVDENKLALLNKSGTKQNVEDGVFYNEKLKTQPNSQ